MPEAGAISVRKSCTEERAGLRLAVIKTDRSGSSLLWTHFRQAICNDCPEMQAELLNGLPRDKPYDEIRTRALGLVESHLSCQEGDACGFSLSLEKHAHWGYLQPGEQAFHDLVGRLKAHRAKVIVLTRRNCFARGVSDCMAYERAAALHRYHDLEAKYRRLLHGCDAFHLWRCPTDVQRRVMNETFTCDERLLRENVKSCKSGLSAYKSLARLLGGEESGRVVSVDYEDLQNSSAWEALHKFLCVGGLAPEWHDSGDAYKRAMRNYDAITNLSSQLGYVWP